MYGIVLQQASIVNLEAGSQAAMLGIIKAAGCVQKLAFGLIRAPILYIVIFSSCTLVHERAREWAALLFYL